jgi:predicted dehydrogenase
MLNTHVLLIGHGSIGKFHLEKLVKLVKIIDVVEPLDANRSVKNPLPPTCEVNFYSKLTELPNKKVYEFAVLANWGPDHVNTILTLFRMGITNFLVEKPLCDSLHDLKIIEELVLDRKIKIISHYQWSYSFLPKIIEENAEKFNLGNTISMVVNGGAKCLVTNGIHYLALAEILFNSEPVESSIIYDNEAINPRNNKFVFLEGNATWKYPNSKYLSINFFNKSRVSIIFIINFEFGYGIIQNERIDLYTIPKDKREQLLSPTRTAIATELVFSGPAFSYPDGRDGSDVIYSLFFNGIRDQDSFHGIQTIKDFILTLEKNTNNEIDRDLSKLSVEQIDKSWNLS